MKQAEQEHCTPVLWGTPLLHATEAPPADGGRSPALLDIPLERDDFARHHIRVPAGTLQGVIGLVEEAGDAATLDLTLDRCQGSTNGLVGALILKDPAARCRGSRAALGG